MGQIYPSGNVYVKTFTPIKEKKLAEIGLNFYPLISEKVKFKKFYSSEFMKQLSDLPDPNKYAAKVFHIPNYEQMEENHIDCGLGRKKKNKTYQYIGAEDYYKTLSDHCESLINLNLYQSDYNNNFSFNVLGLSDKIEDVEILNLVNQVRPVTKDEKKLIQNEIKQDLKNNVECTNEYRRIDSAKMLYLIKSPSIKYDLRISEYFNPGCLGHLSRNIILDFIYQNKVTKTYQMDFYQGAQ